MFKLVNIFVKFVLLLLLVCLVFFTYKKFFSSDKKIYFNSSAVVKKIETFGKLETTKYIFSDIVKYSKERAMFLPNASTVLIVYGEAIGCVDLTNITEKNIKVNNKKEIEISLPAPEICSYKIDLQKSKIYDTVHGYFLTDELHNEALQLAEKNLYTKAIESGILTESQFNAEKVLISLLTNFGYEQISINFTEPSKLNQ